MSFDNDAAVLASRHGRRGIGEIASITFVLTLLVLAAGPVAATASGSSASDSSGGWSTVSSSDVPGVNNFFVGSACADAWECWNVGATSGNGPNAALSGVVQRWNGSSWSAVSTEAPVGRGSVFIDVTCVSSDNC
jgi:hypothetical protein